MQSIILSLCSGFKKQSNQSYLSDSSNDLQSDNSNNEQIAVISDEQSNEEQSKVEFDEEFDIYGHITAYDNSSITTN